MRDYSPVLKVGTYPPAPPPAPTPMNVTFLDKRNAGLGYAVQTYNSVFTQFLALFTTYLVMLRGGLVLFIFVNVLAEKPEKLK